MELTQRVAAMDTLQKHTGQYVAVDYISNGQQQTTQGILQKVEPLTAIQLDFAENAPTQTQHLVGGAIITGKRSIPFTGDSSAIVRIANALDTTLYENEHAVPGYDPANIRAQSFGQ